MPLLRSYAERIDYHIYEYIAPTGLAGCSDRPGDVLIALSEPNLIGMVGKNVEEPP